VWCDASSLAIGTVLEVAGEIVEDCSWLRKQDNMAHINRAELEAVIKGLNLATKWEFECITIMCDLATVVGWLNSLINGDKPFQEHGLGEQGSN
jgi:ribonuclease HI